MGSAVVLTVSGNTLTSHRPSACGQATAEMSQLVSKRERRRRLVRFDTISGVIENAFDGGSAFCFATYRDSPISDPSNILLRKYTGHARFMENACPGTHLMQAGTDFYA